MATRGVFNGYWSSGATGILSLKFVQRIVSYGDTGSKRSFLLLFVFYTSKQKEKKRWGKVKKKGNKRKRREQKKGVPEFSYLLSFLIDFMYLSAFP